MSIQIPDNIVQATRMTELEILQELAITLFQKEKITLGQAAQLASVSQAEMMMLLAARAIPLHYDEISFEQDIQTLRSFKS
jgi:predicted HTH domain antitoxin